MLSCVCASVIRLVYLRFLCECFGKQCTQTRCYWQTINLICVSYSHAINTERALSTVLHTLRKTQRDFCKESRCDGSPFCLKFNYRVCAMVMKHLSLWPTISVRSNSRKRKNHCEKAMVASNGKPSEVVEPTPLRPFRLHFFGNGTSFIDVSSASPKQNRLVLVNTSIAIEWRRFFLRFVKDVVNGIDSDSQRIVDDIGSSGSWMEFSQQL